MREVAIETRRVSICRVVHLLVRVLFAINVLTFAMFASTRFWRLLASLNVLGPLVQMAAFSSLLLPIVSILEAIIVHGGRPQGRRGAIIDIVLTSVWAIGLFAAVLYGLTHYVFL